MSYYRYYFLESSYSQQQKSDSKSRYFILNGLSSYIEPFNLSVMIEYGSVQSINKAPVQLWSWPSCLLIRSMLSHSSFITETPPDVPRYIASSHTCTSGWWSDGKWQNIYTDMYKIDAQIKRCVTHYDPVYVGSLNSQLVNSCENSLNLDQFPHGAAVPQLL